jgi:cation-transporting P-type ATPase E
MAPAGVTDQVVTPASGLGEAEAAARLAAAGGPRRAATSRSYASIVVANVVTVFNAILGVFGALTLAFGDPRDALFLGVVVGNAAIGIVQEVRAKRTLDGLQALVAPTARVVRDGAPRPVTAGEVVPGDLVLLAPGDQLVADGRLAAADDLRLDESILTGEARPVGRATGEEVRSGSFVVEGSGRMVVSAVGEDSYAERIAGQARAFRHPRSPLERALNRLLLWLVAVMVPLGIALGTSLALRHTSLGDAVPKATAAMVSLVPEGLILLAGLTFAVAAVRMARQGALAQQINAIESLASADVICLDKTGTLTDAALRVTALVPADGAEEAQLGAALGRYAAAASSRNLTLEAFAAAFPSEPLQPRAQVAFASRRRWSALELDGETLVLGAPELLAPASLQERVARETARGRRVVALARAPGGLDGHDPETGPPPGCVALGLAVLGERLRPDAARTVAFLRAEGVELKVLSGDAPATVAAIAADAGIGDGGDAVDGSRLPADAEALRELVRSASVIGRIAPEDKRRVVEALRDDGRYVAMVGDGVNDVPALKAARLAIAQGSGAQMAKSVADVVLLSGDFATVPGMVAEGRRILRNVQRVARLFVTKAAFAAFLILTIGLSAEAYPLLPRHLTVASTFGVGLPAFFLALAPSSGPWRAERFLADLARFAVPAGVAIGAAVLAAYLVALQALDMPLAEARTVATTVMLGGMLWLIVELERGPAAPGRAVAALALLMAAGYVAVLLVPAARTFFALARPDAQAAAMAAGGVLLAWALTSAALRAGRRRHPDR